MIRRALAVVLLAVAGAGTAVGISAAVGPAATTLGVATESVNSDVVGPSAVVQAADELGGPSYAIPPGGGVISSWSAQVVTAVEASGPIDLNIVRTTSDPTQDLIVAQDQQNPGNVTAKQVKTFTTRLPVSGGDRLGVYVPSPDAIAAQGGSTGSGDIRQNGDVELAPGTTPQFTSDFASHSHLELSAVVEPDADHDNFGDVTQDACPTDAARQALPCAADLGVALAVLPASVPAGGVALIAGRVTVVSGSATGAIVAVALPAGLQLVAAATTAGACTGTTTLTCPLGDIGSASQQLVVVVQTVGPGTFAVGAAVSSDGVDANPTDNAASASVVVSPAPATTATTTTVTTTTAPSSIPKTCVVPPLKGLTETKAKSLIKTFGCKLGKVAKRRIKKHTHPKLGVVSFSPKLGTRAKLGTKVNVTIGALRR